MTVSVRGTSFKLEVGSGGNAKGLRDEFAQVKAAA